MVVGYFGRSSGDGDVDDFLVVSRFFVGWSWLFSDFSRIVSDETVIHWYTFSSSSSVSIKSILSSPFFAGSLDVVHGLFWNRTY